jgi:hypothetical protein
VIRRLIQLAIFLLIANGLYQTAPAFMHSYQFKDALQELALFSQKSADAQLIDRVMALADEHDIPLERDYIQIHRSNAQLIINVSYIETMKVVPGYDYVRQFDIEAKAFDATR